MYSAICLLHLLNFILSINAQQRPPPYRVTDLILLNSGSPEDNRSLDGRRWDSDVKSKYCPSNSETSYASEQNSVPAVPYMTARIIRSKYTCTFPVSTGPKFIRLYFYPTSYSDLNVSESFFTVVANDCTLLSNFSAYLTVSAVRPKITHFVREFIVTIWDNQVLNLTFTPSPTSFAFINGIEIVSMPSNLYTTDMSFSHPYANQLYTSFYFDNTTCLETVLRLNIGGFEVESGNDTGMFRTWFDDSEYIFGGQFGYVHRALDNVTIKYTTEPAYVAPETVYRTKRTMGPYDNVNQNSNLTWLFSVDPGFNYLLRFHFCETDEQITKENQRVFFIFINNMTAEEEADVIHWSGGREIAVYKDYIVWVPEGDGSHKQQDLWVALHPNTQLHPTYLNVILNGLEIFKLNHSDGNLAGPNPELIRVPAAPPEQHPRRIKNKKSSLVIEVVGAVIGVVLAFSLMLLIHRRKVKVEDTGTTTTKSSWKLFSSSASSATITLSLPTDICRKFTMAEIKAATSNFDAQNVIGCGGFGTVYKGYIERGSIPVAIKRLDSSSKQGIREFHTEIEMLSRLRHVHLVSLIGYCDEQREMILVYEFMPHGTLQDHLYKTDNPAIPWKQRLQICIGAARGLHYLHTGSKHTIIHRDVKPSNILLGRNWVAKVSDFGLSKTGPTSESQTHVSTAVKGSFGYLDPEYYRRQQLTEKSDVYSFGVVLFEVLCARKPIISTKPKEQVNLVEWARNCYKKGALDQIVDQQLKGDIASVSLNKFGEIAESCVRDKANERPTMGDVVWSLEFALQLQETAERKVNAGDAVSENQKSTSVQGREVITTDDGDIFTFSGGQTSGSRSTVSAAKRSSTTNSDRDGMRSGTVFSEMRNPEGR